MPGIILPERVKPKDLYHIRLAFPDREVICVLPVSFFRKIMHTCQTTNGVGLTPKRTVIVHFECYSSDA